MKPFKIVKMLVVLVALAALAQQSQGAKRGHAENVRLTEENGAVSVCYDLKLEIARVTLVGTGNGQPLTINAVTGDVGIVFGPADNLCVRWEVAQDYPAGLADLDVFLDIVAKAFQPPQPEAGQAAQPEKAKATAVVECISEKFNKGMKSEKDAYGLAIAEYSGLLGNDQTYYLQLMQKMKGGVPYVRRYERDREGRQIPIYDTQEISERERVKIQREIDNVLEKAERNPESVLSSETRRAKDRLEQAIDRLFTRVAGLCEQETGVPAPTILNLVRAGYGQAYTVPEPFADIRRDRDWE